MSHASNPLQSHAAAKALSVPPDGDSYEVCGVVTEYCVRCAVLGLLRTGQRVELVEDAVKSLDDEASRRTLEEFTSGGGRVTTAAEVCAS